MAERPKAPLGHYILVISTDLMLAADTVAFALHVKLLTIVAYNINIHTTCRTMSVTFNLKDVAYVAFGSVQSPSGALPSRTSRNLYTHQGGVLSWAFLVTYLITGDKAAKSQQSQSLTLSPAGGHTAQLLKSETVVGPHMGQFKNKNLKKAKLMRHVVSIHHLYQPGLNVKDLYPWSHV